MGVISSLIEASAGSAAVSIAIMSIIWTIIKSMLQNKNLSDYEAKSLKETADFFFDRMKISLVLFILAAVYGGFFALLNEKITISYHFFQGLDLIFVLKLVPLFVFAAGWIVIAISLNRFVKRFEII